jgi:hypothetical protein
LSHLDLHLEVFVPKKKKEMGWVGDVAARMMFLLFLHKASKIS